MSVAITTGAASGMGRACAERFLSEGWQVAALDRMPADLDGALALVADITDASAVAAAVERAVAELGPPEAVVNAAGVYPPSTLETATTELFRRTFDVNASMRKPTRAPGQLLSPRRPHAASADARASSPSKRPRAGC
jgi:NAD(P)-dependent dehydrogenase (short-subunit alcohol dehydrogenase family)